MEAVISKATALSTLPAGTAGCSRYVWSLTTHDVLRSMHRRGSPRVWPLPSRPAQLDTTLSDLRLQYLDQVPFRIAYEQDSCPAFGGPGAAQRFYTSVEVLVERVQIVNLQSDVDRPRAV